jgi:hypothetical protein
VPIFTVGEPFINPYAFNRQSLVPDPVTDPAAWNDAPASPQPPTPMHSPWGNAVVLPEVPYGAITTGQAVQPALTLPPNLISASDLGGGITFQTWFQAKGPGALLTAGLTQSGPSAHYQAPLVYIDSSGKLVAGLFDPTHLTVQQLQGQNPTVFSWKDADGQTQIAAANPLVSQSSVVDNTWHHVAFVANAKGQALYLDGMLQGTGQPLNHDSFTSTSSAPVTTLTVPLTGRSNNGGLISGSIWEGGYQAYTFEGWVQGQQPSLNLTQTYNQVVYQGGTSYPTVTTPPYVISNVTYDGSGSTPSLVLTLSGSAPANALTVHAAYATATSKPRRRTVSGSCAAASAARRTPWTWRASAASSARTDCDRTPGGPAPRVRCRRATGTCRSSDWPSCWAGRRAPAPRNRSSSCTTVSAPGACWSNGSRRSRASRPTTSIRCRQQRERAGRGHSRAFSGLAPTSFPCWHRPGSTPTGRRTMPGRPERTTSPARAGRGR